MSWRGKIGLMGVVGLTAVFRFHALFANTFHADEALFASWARLIAVWRDSLLLTQAVDKPPLLFYLQALFYPLQGPVAWAARLPNFIASLVIVPLLGVLVWRWYRDEITAVFAALLLALSPFAIQFSATAFTDPLMVMWVVASLMAASGGRRVSSTRHPPPATRHEFLTGFLFGLAVATKYQAWLFLPLLGGVGWLAGWRWRDWLRFALGLGAVLLAVLLWDFVRTGQFSLWGRQMGNFGGVRLSWSWELGARLAAWGRLILLNGYPLAVLRWLLLVFWALAIGRPLWGLGKELLQRNKETKEQRDLAQQALRDQMLALFVVGYGVAHWLLAVPVWDRYVLAVVPWLAVLGARQLAIVNWQLAIVNCQWRGRGVAFIVLSLLLLVLLPGAWGARNGRFAIGGFPAADGGAGQIAAYLHDAPYGTVLYDHWFSWQWRYHLFDRGVYVNWTPNPSALAEDLTVFGDDGNLRFIVLPTDGAERPFVRAVEFAGFSLEPIPEAGGAQMILYRIQKE